MPLTPFQYSDYATFLRAAILAGRAVRGYQSRMAEAAGCQRSQFSQVVKGRMVLTLEQAAGLAAFWQLAEAETEYFLVLVQLSRAGTPVLRRHFERQAARIREGAENFGERLRAPRMTEAAVATYFSNWYWAAIHVLVALPGHDSAQKIARRLGLPVELVDRSLETLESFGILRRAAVGWELGDVNIHLPKTSPMTRVNHANWRRRAERDVEREGGSSLHFTSVFALSKADAVALRADLAEKIVSLREKVAASASEEIYAFTLDWFRV